MSRSGMDGAMDHLVQAIERKRDATDALLRARAETSNACEFLVSRAEKRLAAAELVVLAATEGWNHEVKLYITDTRGPEFAQTIDTYLARLTA